MARAVTDRHKTIATVTAAWIVALHHLLPDPLHDHHRVQIGARRRSPAST